jgi:hypothetical protein
MRFTEKNKKIEETDKTKNEYKILAKLKKIQDCM